MNIEGTYTLQAPSTAVWHSLLDTQLLQHMIPGVESLQQVSEHAYAVVFTLKQVPFKGTYQGQITLSERCYPTHYCLTLASEGEHGSINGTGSIHLREQDKTTIVTYQAILTYSMPATLLTLKLLKGAAKHRIQQFFSHLATQLPAQEYCTISNSLQRGQDRSFNAAIADKALSPFSHNTIEYNRTSRVFSTIGQVLGLERDDHETLRWPILLRNASLLSALLLLVWIGTRLPSRK